MATNSQFDSDAFLNTEVQGANSTKTIPVPEGEYRGVVESIKSRTWTGDDGTLYFCDVNWKLDDPDQLIKGVTKREKNFVKQGLRLDVTDVGGGRIGLDMSEGMNANLGKLRLAVGQNYSDRPWTFSNLIGAVANLTVAHRTDKETGDTFAEVKKTAPLA